MPTLCRDEKFLPLPENEQFRRSLVTALTTLSRLTTVCDLHGAYIKMRQANTNLHRRRTDIQNIKREIRRDERKCRWEDATETDRKMKLRLRMWGGLQLRTHYRNRVHHRGT